MNSNLLLTNLAIAVAIQSATSLAGAASLVVDEFNTTKGFDVSNFGYQSSTVTYSALDSPVDAIGGSRQAFVKISNASSFPFDYVRAKVGDGALTYSSSTATHGFLGLIYTPAATAQSFDLSQNFADGDSIFVWFSSVLTVPISFTISIHSSPSGSAGKTISIPAGMNSAFIPLPSLSLGGGFDPARITYFSPRFSTDQNGAEFKIDRIAIVPEPASELLAFVGCFILASRRANLRRE